MVLLVTTITLFGSHIYNVFVSVYIWEIRVICNSFPLLPTFFGFIHKKKLDSVIVPHPKSLVQSILFGIKDLCWKFEKNIESDIFFNVDMVGETIFNNLHWGKFRWYFYISISSIIIYHIINVKLLHILSRHNIIIYMNNLVSFKWDLL